MNKLCAFIGVLSLALFAWAPSIEQTHIAIPGIENFSAAASAEEGVLLKQLDDRVEITIDGKPFSAYYTSADQPKPYLHPLRAADGATLTRGYPMIKDDPNEASDRDHPHHRSCWFTHGDVNGVDFWSEGPRSGKIVHRGFDKIESGKDYGRLVARNDWVAPDGKRVLQETREIKFYRLADARMMDWTITLRPVDGPVKFGDTKEGTFGIRLATQLKGRLTGRIENSRGAVGEKEAWGKPAEWCDYTGLLQGKRYGIAIFDHPSNFRHPTYWHVRDYGLFAANPFGERDFFNDKTRDGSYAIQPGKELTFRYRVYIHQGTAAEAKVAEQYQAYVKSAGK